MTDKLRDDLAEVRKLQLRFHELEDGDDRDSVGVTGDLMAGEFVENYHAQIQRNAEDAARYRFLRSPTCPIDFTEMRWEAQDCMDQYIDAAMRANGGEVE